MAIAVCPAECFRAEELFAAACLYQAIVNPVQDGIFGV
jgi:hypothetical protein